MTTVVVKPSNGEFEVWVDDQIFQLCHSHNDALALRTLIINEGKLELMEMES